MLSVRQGIITVIFILLTAAVAVSEPTAKTEAEHKEITAYRITGSPPVIDGNLDDDIWSQPGLVIGRGFTQRAEDEGMPATESTLVAVAYDDEALYAAFWCYDSEPDKISKRLARRDRLVSSDQVSIRMDPYHDRQSGYYFLLNASGVKVDMRIYNDDDLDDSWDAVWDGNVKMHDWGWSAEFKIPFHCLRFIEKDDNVWGINFMRIIDRKTESLWWNWAPTTIKGFVSHFGTLRGLKDIKPTRHLEVMPYSVAQYNTEPKNIGNENGKETLGNVGLDMKYGISSNLTLDLTVNPDFGQVELDQPVLNLSSFETYYSEKRPFFLEGADLFETEFRLFYSRRIGRAPSKSINDTSLENFLEYPNATTILGAAKISGKVGKKTSLAFLNAVTDKETADYITTDKTVKSGIVEPSSNYSVFRIKQELYGNSNIGGLFTLASQDGYHPSATGGIDWNLYTLDYKYAFMGQAVFSRNDNKYTGYGYDLTFEKASGNHIRGSVGVHVTDPHLDLNRLGFLSSNNARETWGWVQYRTVNTWWIVRNSWNNFNIYGGWNFDNVNTYKGWNVNTQFEFINSWTLSGGFNYNYAALDQYETRGNGLWLEPLSYSWWASLNTDSRKKVSYVINPGSGVSRNGSWWANYVGIEVRPKTNMSYEVGVNYLRTNNAARWVENDNGKAIFADLDKDEFQLSLITSYIPLRNLSIQFSGEGVLAALDYENYREYLDGDNYSASLTGYNHDYIWTALNTTFILRWEYNSGSTLYLVWTRSRMESDNRYNFLRLNRDLDRYISDGSRNTFLIKASYWVNI